MIQAVSAAAVLRIIGAPAPFRMVGNGLGHPDVFATHAGAPFDTM
jgi:hypothetical protein